MISYCRDMTSQTRFFGPGDQHRPGRILMRVMAVYARDPTRAFTPALAILQCRHLIGNEQVMWQGICDQTGALVTVGTWPYSLGDGQRLRVQYAEVSRLRAERR